MRIRDPFILTDSEHGCYYMYGTIDLLPDSYGTLPTFSVCKSYDLEHFDEPKVIFDARKTSFWADRHFWAPEVHKYNGRYYLFGSCKAEGKWTHGGSRFDFDGGHAMIFTSLEGKRMISLHSPNKTNFERATFYEI